MYPNEHSRVGFILAGGKSVRMGTDKAFLDFAGETLLTRALRIMSEACEEVKIVGDPAKFTAPNYETIADVFPDSGPLGGIHSALTWSSSELNLMLAVDMPFISADLLVFLLRAAGTDTAAITVPSVDGRLQPLCAVYRREFAAYAEDALRAGKFKIDAAFAGVKTRVIEEDELVAAGFSAHNFVNMNTPQDLRNQR